MKAPSQFLSFLCRLSGRASTGRLCPRDGITTKDAVQHDAQSAVGVWSMDTESWAECLSSIFKEAFTYLRPTVNAFWLLASKKHLLTFH